MRSSDGLGRPRRGRDDRPARSPVQAIARIAPPLILARNSFLAMVKTNVFRLATHLRLIFIDPEVAKKSNLNQSMLQKAMAQRPKIERKWKNLGGDLQALKSAIAHGAHVPVSALGSLGDGGATALAASAAAVLAVVVPVISEVNWKDGKDDEGKKLDGAALADGLSSIINKAKKDKAVAAFTNAVESLADGDPGPGATPPSAPADKNLPPADEPKGMPWWGWLLIGTATVGGGYLLYSQQEKKEKKNGK
jgi:hypothetical protein